MSLYPIDKMIRARTFIEMIFNQLEGQKEKYLNVEQEGQLCEILSLEKNDLGKDLNHLLDFCVQLPPAEDLIKIEKRLMELAQSAYAKIESTSVWDIVPKERWLLCTVSRNERLVTLGLNWKDADKDRPNPRFIYQQVDQWVRDREAEGGWRYEILCPEYHSLIAHVESWLKKPLAFPKAA